MKLDNHIQVEIIGYTNSQKIGIPQNIDSNSKKCYAKKREHHKIDENNQVTNHITHTEYLIAIDDNGIPFNPWGIDTNTVQRKFQRRELKFAKTHKEAFQHYLNFLQTKNLAWLRKTTREIVL